MLERGATLRGTVRFRRAVAPVADVRVELVPEGELWEGAEPPACTADTDGEGKFELEGLARGRWSVTLRSAWGAVAREAITMPGAGEELEKTFELWPAAQVIGKVYDEEGAAVSGARVWITARPDDRDYDWGGLASAAIDSPFLASAVTDTAGQYRLERIPARESLWILALPPGEGAPDERPGHLEPLRLKDGEVRTGVDLVLEGGTELEGLVVDEDGRGIPDVSIEAFHVRWGFSSPGRTATTDAEGRFRVGPLPFGATRVEFSGAGYRSARQGLSLEEGQPREIEQVLQRAFPVVGQVVDEAGWGIEGARLTARIGPRRGASVARPIPSGASSSRA